MKIKAYPHHVRGVDVDGRPMYRRGRRPTAAKVFTVATESQHILVFGVPAIGLQEQLTSESEQYGEVTVTKVEDYENLEEFTDLYHLQFPQLSAARVAKRRLDGLEFYGGVLHVCYAPELETVEETRSKIIQRSKQVYAKVKTLKRQRKNDRQTSIGNSTTEPDAT